MKPDFALSLSFEGISLLARAAGGWRVAGDVGLDAPDLKAALADLRVLAVGRGGQAFRTKLIIPRDQIRYLTVETGHLSAADRHAEVQRALDGATPYAVEDLVYDICEDGALTHVAAVARETLDEAEAFAAEHKFNPVSFVAIPGDEAFMGEPFFGATRFARKALMSGERVEPDGVAVVITGRLEDEPKPEAATIAETSAARDPGVDKAGEEEPASDDDTADSAAGAEPLAGFSSRRSTGQAPTLGGAKRSSEPSGTAQIAPRITIAAPPKSDEPAPPAPEARPVARPVPGPDLSSAQMPKPGQAAAQPIGGTRVLDANLAAADAQNAAAAKTWKDRFLSRQAEAERTKASQPKAAAPLAAPKAAPTPKPVLPEATAQVRPSAAESLSRAKSAIVAAARRPVPEARPVAAGPSPDEDERRRMTIFGARSDVVVGGKPRHLGLILTALLLVFLAAVAAWASIFMEEGVAGLFGKRQPEIVAVVPGPVEPEPEPSGTAALSTPSPAPSALPQVEDEEELSDADRAVLDALRDAETEQAAEAAPSIDPASIAPLTLEEAQSRYAVTGIWERAPDPPRVAGLVDLDSLYLTSIDRAVAAQDAVALVVPEAQVSDILPGRISQPITPGLTVTLGPDGRVIPTPEGSVSPDGFTVFLGRPPVVPPPTPTRFETTPAAALPEAQAPDLPRTRPQTRPEGLVEGNERSQFGGLTRQELAGLRPRVRPLIEEPAGIAETPEAPPQETTAGDFVSATSQAVLASLAPRQRPAGFADVVSAARSAPSPAPQAEAEEEPTRVAAVASAAPRIPSSASVARQATVRNAINLRQVNLIGVYGTPANRRALVRLPNGRYQKVTVGDRLDGGQVSAIGDSELRYQKNGRNLTLTIPSG